MIVTVVAVSVVQAALMDVIHVVAVRNALFPLRLVVTGALGSSALRRVCSAH
jgi:hypothetical protein